jgi:hypothetical protein
MKDYVYILQDYANEQNIEHNAMAKEDEYKVEYSKKQGVLISLVETNRLAEDEYFLNLKSVKFVVEGMTEVKESAIHHHKKGETFKHLQFKLQAKKETIRIDLEPLDMDDYRRCIKGFLHIAKDIIIGEQETCKIKEDLKEYFFSDKIDSLLEERKFLLEKISEADKLGLITDKSGKSLDKERLLELRKETHLAPFFNYIDK